MTIPRNISFLAEGASSTGVLSTAFGGTGVANNAASTVTISGNFGTTLTVTGTTAVTLPTSGTLLNTTGSGSSLTFVTGSLSLAGNLTTSGANALTFTTTGTTNVTLPTSGTLSTVALSGTNTWTGTQTLTGSSSVLAGVFTNLVEPITISATAATGTIALYPSTQSILYYTTSASANFTINLTFSAGTTLNTAMTTGQAITVVFMNTNGATAYYNNVVQVDGSTVTPKWQGGTAPTGGNASSVDVYTYTVIKTGSAAFTVLASQTKFA